MILSQTQRHMDISYSDLCFVGCALVYFCDCSKRELRAGQVLGVHVDLQGSAAQGVCAQTAQPHRLLS